MNGAPVLEVQIPSDEEVQDAISELDAEAQAAVRQCVVELDEMAEQFGEDVLMIASMVVSARLAREEPLN